ncbi:hypothetical protein D3C81_1564300 [compost metagenome]
MTDLDMGESLIWIFLAPISEHKARFDTSEISTYHAVDGYRQLWLTFAALKRLLRCGGLDVN